MNLTIIDACCDLGVHVNGSEKGPTVLDKSQSTVKDIRIIEKDNIKKELSKENKAKNLDHVNRFNEKLYKEIISITDKIVITLGGDHSIAIASALASKKKHGNIGLIWIDSHSDFHTFESTISGNIHGMPFATISGQNGNRLSYFFDGEYYDPKKTVLVGARDIDAPEYINLEKAGTKVFTTEDIRKYGVEEILKKSIEITCNNTSGIHVSYDIDVIDPQIAPGVSIKAKDGITLKEAKDILKELIKRKEKVKSFDLVEYNPDLDIDNKTYKIGSFLLNELINNIKE